MHRSVIDYSDNEILYNSEKEWLIGYMATCEPQKRAEWKRQVIGKFIQRDSSYIELKKVKPKKFVV